MPEHITKWNQASSDWHCPKAINDLNEGGRFSFTMAAKDKSASFDFTGVYTQVEPYKTIGYKMDDDRDVEINFEVDDLLVTIKETFDAESTHTLEQQKEGWQSILNNFRDYVQNMSK